MKMLSKISAIVLVVAMMLTMVSVTGFAAGIEFDAIDDFRVVVTDASGAEINSAKAGTTVYVKAYGGAGSYSNGGFMGEFAYDIDWDNVETSANLSMSSWDSETKVINLSWLSPLTEEDKNPLAVIPVPIPESAPDGNVDIVKDYGTSYTVDTVLLNAEFPAVTIKVSAPWDATGFAAIDDVEVALGTSEADAIDELPSTVTVTGAVDGQSEPRQAAGWTKVGTYDAGAPGTYQFKTAVVADDDKLAVIPADFEVTANVVVTKLDTTIEDITTTIQAAAGLSADDLKAKLPTTYTVTVGDFTEDVDIAWVLNTADEGTATITGAVGEYKNFIGTVTSDLFNIPNVNGRVVLENSINYRDLVATIGDFSYDSLAAAVAATAEGDIILQNDSNDTAGATIDRAVVIDLNGHIYDGPITVGTGSVTFKGDGIVNGAINGDITVEGGAFYGTITGTVNATGGSFPAGTNVLAGTGYHTVTMSDDRIAVAENAEEATDKITLEFRPTADAHVFDMVLVAEDGKVINEFVSAEFEFTNASKTTSGADMLYTIAGTDSIAAVRALKEVNEVGAAVQTWGFAVQDKDDHDDIISAAEIKLGTVTFDGYGQIDFKATAGVVHTTLEATNNEFHYVVDGSLTDGNLLDITTDAISGTEGLIEEVKRTVNVNLHFVNDITAGVETTYNQMEVSIVGENADYEDPAPVAIGDAKVESNTLAKASFEVVAGYRYTVTVKGAGYRTARYTTIVDAKTEALELHFWNNVKSGSGEPFAEIEEGVSGLSAKNFLAGDIAMDNIVDKYDLAAVISYFGTYELDKDHKPEYVKYDLNRDGKIDSEDIAYVLYSIGE